MPTPEQQPTTGPALGAGAETVELQEQADQHYKTVAVRIEEQVHAQLQFIAQLSGTTISREIRQAIQGRITSALEDPELIARAQAARDEIEREAAARTAAISGFLGKPATANATSTGATKGPGATRRGSR